MSELPDELWRQILEIGVNSHGLNYKDLCCVSISSRRLRRLSDDDCFWSHLLSSDYPSSSSSFPSSASSSKSLYKIRYEKEYMELHNFSYFVFVFVSSCFLFSSGRYLFVLVLLVRLERDRNRKKRAHRRAVLRKDSQIAEHYRKLGALENQLMEETNKLTTTLTELSNLRRVR